MGLSAYGIIVFLIGLFALNASYRWSIYALVVSCVLACAVAITLPGGIGIMPANLFLVFYVIRAFNLGGGKMLTESISLGKPGFWLFCTCAWGVFGAIVLPRALAGSTLVFTIFDRSADPNTEGLLRPLGPVSGNLSQSFYCVGDLVVFCCSYVFMKRRGAYDVLGKAMLALTACDVLAAALDLGGHFAGVDALAFVKTAQYAYFIDSELGGMLRISGTFSEASAFAFFTLQLFAVCINLWLVGYRRKISGALAGATGVLLLISTSGSAYVGLAAYLLVLLASRPSRVSATARARKTRMWTIMICAGILGALYMVLFMPGVVRALSDFADATVLSKADSQSGVERSSFNTQAFTNFLDTYGIGVGLGSIRVSSFVMVVLASLGVLGSVCYTLFFVKSALAPIPREYPATDRAVAYAARHGMYAALIVASVSASVFDLGVSFYVLAAAAGGLTVRARAPVRVNTVVVDAQPEPAVQPAPARDGRPGAWPKRGFARQSMPRRPQALARGR
ncbi:O-antigen ligase family protein [Paraburkholderia bannensis]|uniref:O-antigen ligase family protein n=1 Tax=Paraburkholderia bannensis TaxID=765414 RepID=UPI002ABD9FB4|nr:O-antigen ligase family protein [Paraburkholderia bannensis]